MTDIRTSDPHDESVSVVRHEERLAVRTETVARERVRMEKYIVSEERTVTVTVRREEVRVVREPLSADEPLGDVFDEFPRVFTLSEEQVVMSTRVVPVERVWLEKTRVTEEQTVTGDLGREVVELDRT